MEINGLRGLSLTGDYNRAGTAPVARHRHPVADDQNRGKNFKQLVPCDTHFTPQLLQLAAFNPIRGK